MIRSISRQETVDSIDITILERLMSEGRATWAALGEATGLFPAALAQRVRRLERDELMGKCKVAETRTSIVLTTAKHTTALAVGR
jgi:DNA-binding HxlR family transcriptional regulator